ncbi:MAG TPA: hypothetical protein VHY58_14940 [Streptosporangiaceae bacterium]|jgi:hypothetical protein|nr:hypothetical protein [Streptosporangiaceae bacterium]
MNSKNQTSGPDNQTTIRPSVMFGARAAVLAGVVAATCAVSAPSAAPTAAGHPAAHTLTAVALGATSAGAVTAMDTTCCG